MRKKVLVGCPTADLKAYCLEPYVKALQSLTYANFDVLLVDNSKTDDYMKKIISLGVPCLKSVYTESIPERVVNGRNYLRAYALEKGYDYLLSLEQDVIAPVNLIETLLATGEDIVSGVTSHLLLRNNTIQEITLLGLKDKDDPEKFVFFNYHDVLRYKSGIIPVDYAAMGCLLISRKVLEKVKFRYEKRKDSFGDTDVNWDDICFCRDAQQQGFKLCMNLAAKCEHLYYGGYSATLGDTTSITKTRKASKTI